MKDIYLQSKDADETENEDLMKSIPKISNEFAITDKSLQYPKKLLESMVDYKELVMMYTCALKEIKTKFEVLDTEFNVSYSRNPINFINTRIKRTSSIAEKLGRRGLEFNIENIRKNINDIAGIRVICSYVDDIYFLAQALSNQDDITIITVKDYIKNPKPNGYRSLHMIVSIPIFFAKQKHNMKVEVQIRTIAMDFWASLEHQMKYKKQIEGQSEIAEQLRQCADTIAKTDAKMLELRQRIEKDSEAEKNTELIDKLKRIDVSIQ